MIDLSDAEYIDRAMADMYANEAREKRAALRDQIAIAAMAALTDRNRPTADICREAYEYADEMLIAREK